MNSNTLRVRCQPTAESCAAIPPHKQCVKKEGEKDRRQITASGEKNPAENLLTVARRHRERTHPPFLIPGSGSSCSSERFEVFRKTKILVVVHRTIDHRRFSA